jgi:hypothetical protein
MKRCAILLILATSTSCADKPVVVAVDTLCTSTTRFHATENQMAAMKQDQLLWQPLVEWLASFNLIRDDTCLKPAAGN